VPVTICCSISMLFMGVGGPFGIPSPYINPTRSRDGPLKRGSPGTLFWDLFPRSYESLLDKAGPTEEREELTGEGGGFSPGSLLFGLCFFPFPPAFFFYLISAFLIPVGRRFNRGLVVGRRLRRSPFALSPFPARDMNDSTAPFSCLGSMNFETTPN